MKKNINNKLSFRKLIWLGFNITLGITYVITFKDIVSGEKGVGYLIYLVIILSAITAGGIAWAFARLSTIFYQSNGISYSASRHAFGSYSNFIAWVVGFTQYIIFPIIVTNWILGLFTLALDAVPFFSRLGLLVLFGINKMQIKSLGLGNINDKNFIEGTFREKLSDSHLYDQLLNKQDLILNIVGILLFLSFASFSVRRGLRSFHFFTDFAAFIKWGISGLIIILMFILAFKKGNLNYPKFFSDKEHLNNSIVLTRNFNHAFMTFFYFFLGFETFSSVARNTYKPEIYIKKAIVWVLVISTVIYLLETTLMIGALGEFKVVNALNEIALLSLGIFGIILLFFQQIALKINGSAQFSLYGGGILKQLADDNYLPQFLKKTRKGDDFPQSGSWFYIANTIVFTFCLIVLPYFFHASVRDITSILQLATFFYLIVYFFTILACFQLVRKKQIQWKWYELIYWIFSFFLIIYFWSFHFYDTYLINFLARADDINVLGVTQFFLFIFYLIFLIWWYLIFFKPKNKIKY